jgi:hypothetical protein
LPQIPKLNLMKKLALLLLSFACMQTVQAQINVTGNGFSYTQDFNSLDTNATNSNNLPTGWAIKEIGTSSSANNLYRTGTGSSNAGDTYSFGTIANTDRALGTVASNTNSPSFGVRFNNTSNDTITRLVVSFRMEQWRAGDTSSKTDTMYFMYSIVADSVGDTTSANWTEVSSLMMKSVTPSAATNQGNALDGNTNNAILNDSFNVTINPGQHIILKWVDRNILGSDDGLAVDDLSLTFKNNNVINSILNVNAKRFDFAVQGTAKRDALTVAFTTAAGKYALSIYDLNGRVVFTKDVQAKNGAQTTTINGLNLTSGMYIIKMTDGANVGIAKTVVE